MRVRASRQPVIKRQNDEVPNADVGRTRRVRARNDEIGDCVDHPALVLGRLPLLALTGFAPDPQWCPDEGGEHEPAADRGPPIEFAEPVIRHVPVS